MGITEIGVAPSDFAEFYRLNATRVRQFMCTFAGRELGNEATAESFARMLERWPELGRLESAQLRAYVLTTAKNYVRRRTATDARIEELDDRHDIGLDDAGLDRVDDRLGLERAVRELIDGQPPRRRQVAMLFFLQNDSYAEIAGFLDISESTVRSHVQALRTQLQPYVRRYQEIVEKSDHA